jgi:hypothetical protein
MGIESINCFTNMNYPDLIQQKFNDLEQRILSLECKLFKLIAALEFIKTLDMNLLQTSPFKEPIPQLF